MQQGPQPRYFWKLDSECSRDLLKDYVGALDGTTKPTLRSVISLLEKKVPVPPRVYLASGCLALADKGPNMDFLNELSASIARLEKLTHAKYGAADRPLLMTVKGDFSGAIRNIGMTLKSLPALIHNLGKGNAFTVYVDFLESFSALVLGCPHLDFRSTFGIEAKREGGAGGLSNLDEDAFCQKVREYQNLVSRKIGKPFPDAPEKQLIAALMRAIRATQGSGGDEIFLEVQVHRSQYGQSVRGVAYTRNPFSGKKDLYGVYEQADGKKAALEPSDSGESSGQKLEQYGATLREKFPVVYATIKKFLGDVESAYRDVMEIEFVSDEDGNVWFTSFDKGQCTARAAVVSAVDLNVEGKLSDREAALRISPKDVEVLLHPTLDESSRSKLTDIGGSGVTAAPGTAIGPVFYTMADAMKCYKEAQARKEKVQVILCADELLISDTPGLGMISGLVTRTGGIASHAAVMARANGIPCIVGYKGIEFASDGKTMTYGGKTVKAGDILTMEAAANGKVYLGKGSMQNLSHQEGVAKEVTQLMGRVIEQERIPLTIRVNINNAKDAQTGFDFGASGVGLCRTENMFMEPEALREIRNIIFTRDSSKCQESFQRLEETQYSDYKKIFLAAKGRSVNIRLMDLPLHDFVPKSQADFDELGKQLSHLTLTHIQNVAETLYEHNPMLGLRASRFGMIVPDVYNMQIRAILRAAYAAAKEGVKCSPGIMFPLVCTEQELYRLKARVVEIEGKILEEFKIPFGQKIRVKVGTMVELPAAVLSADKLARESEFFAFGTNDLTQTTMGISRDDAAHYLPQYLEQGIFSEDPFRCLAAPVREMIQFAVKRGRRVRPSLNVGICGEQGGDHDTLKFGLENGLDYVSASPYRVLPSVVALVHCGVEWLEKNRKETPVTEMPVKTTKAAVPSAKAA